MPRRTTRGHRPALPTPRRPLGAPPVRPVGGEPRQGRRGRRPRPAAAPSRSSRPAWRPTVRRSPGSVPPARCARWRVRTAAVRPTSASACLRPLASSGRLASSAVERLPVSGPWRAGPAATRSGPAAPVKTCPARPCRIRRSSGSRRPAIGSHSSLSTSLFGAKAPDCRRAAKYCTVFGPPLTVYETVVSARPRIDSKAGLLPDLSPGGDRRRLVAVGLSLG